MKISDEEFIGNAMSAVKPWASVDLKIGPVKGAWGCSVSVLCNQDETTIEEAQQKTVDLIVKGMSKLEDAIECMVRRLTNETR